MTSAMTSATLPPRTAVPPASTRRGGAASHVLPAARPLCRSWGRLVLTTATGLSLESLKLGPELPTIIKEA